MSFGLICIYKRFWVCIYLWCLWSNLWEFMNMVHEDWCGVFVISICLIMDLGGLRFMQYLGVINCGSSIIKLY